MFLFHRLGIVWLVGVSDAMVRNTGFSSLTRKHGIKVGANGSLCGMEDVALAVGEAIGYDSVKSAARIY